MELLKRTNKNVGNKYDIHSRDSYKIYNNIVTIICGDIII